jgi:hypothetical protein
MSGQRHPDGGQPDGRQPDNGHSDERHPDAAELAEYQAGLADGRRGRRLAAHVANCDRCTSYSDQLAAVSSALASAPVPPLPDAVESRITAALAAEAATKEPRHTAPRHLPGLGRSRRTHENTGPRPSRGDTPGPPRRARDGRRSSPAVLLSAAAAACLVLFGAVFGLIHLSSGSGSSSAASSAASAPVSRPEIAGPAAGGPDEGAAGSAEKATFTVTMSGTQYEPATLAAQVHARLAAKSPGTASPASAQLPTRAPNAALAGCVLHLTGQARPSLVDLATYQGKPAYVIAGPDHAWVVGPDCTASDPHLIASIGL